MDLHGVTSVEEVKYRYDLVRGKQHVNRLGNPLHYGVLLSPDGDAITPFHNTQATT